MFFCGVGVVVDVFVWFVFVEWFFFVVKNFEIFFLLFFCCCGGKNAAGLVSCQNKTWTNALTFLQHFGCYVCLLESIP